MHPDQYFEMSQARLAEVRRDHRLHRHRRSAQRPRPPSRPRRALAAALRRAAERLAPAEQQPRRA